MRAATLGLLVALSACSSTVATAVDGSADVAPDAAEDVATIDDVSPADAARDVAVDARDVPAVDARVDVVTDALTDVLADAAPDDAAGEAPLDGVWRVVEIACDGLPASEAARRYITEPNRSSFEVRGARSTYTLTTSTCTMRLLSTVTYPSAGRAIFTATGPFTCSPTRCAVGCDTTPERPYVYDYARRADGLVMTTIGPTPDVTCTAYGQSNPITYTYTPVR